MDFSDKYRSAGKIIVFRVGEDVLVTSPIKNRRDYLLFNKVPLSLMTHPDTKHFQMVISQGFVLASYTSPSPLHLLQIITITLENGQLIYL